MRTLLFVSLAAALISSGASRAISAQPCDGCAAPCQAAVPCQAYELVEKTVMVPTWVTETRKVNVTEYRREPRERTYTVTRMVPETNAVTEEYTVMVPEHRTTYRAVHRQQAGDEAGDPGVHGQRPASGRRGKGHAAFASTCR